MSYDIHALRAAGATYREIAEMTGLSQGVVFWRLNPKSKARAAVPPAPTLRPRRHVGQQERKCLCCGSRFPSEGPHNRLCNACRRQGVSPFDVPAVVHHR